MNRTDYEACKKREIDRLNFEIEVMERQLEMLYERTLLLEGETYELAKADETYEIWKSKRVEL